MSDSKTIKLTYRQATEISDGIAALDATDKEKGKPLYKFDQLTKLSFSAKRRTLAGHVEVLGERRNAMLKEHNITGLKNDKDQPVDAPDDVKSFNEAWEKLVKSEVEGDFTFRPISIEELKLDANQIPIWVLTAIDVILTGAPDEGGKKKETSADE
jgi:hypothetical protein